MNKRELRVGEVVQIDPEHDDVFGGCFMQVIEPKCFGAQGFVKVPGKDGGFAYYRVSFANMEPVGMATWLGGHADAAQTPPE